jgi:GT2 family glycosyltransferase
MTKIYLSIIIVNWNSKDYLRSCVDSILSSIKNIEYEIIVVDSASFDGCGIMLQECYPQVRFFQSKLNIGFARANNLGAEYARGNILLFLNPDTEVLDNAIEKLCKEFNKLQHAGVVGCRLLNGDRTLQKSCVMPIPTILNQFFDVEILQRYFPKVSLWMSAAMFDGVKLPVAVDAISGACMMISREVFDKVKGFSLDYFMYAEDVDLCYKIFKAGFYNYYIPNVEIVHFGGGSSQHKRSVFSDVMILESISVFLRKTRGNFYNIGFRLALSLSALFRLMLLVVFLPFSLIIRKSEEWKTAFNKWIAIFRWGLGMEKWVFQYRQPKESIIELVRDHEK